MARRRAVVHPGELFEEWESVCASSWFPESQGRRPEGDDALERFPYHLEEVAQEGV